MPFVPKFAIIYLIASQIKNLLPRKVFERVALNLKLSKTKLRFPKRVSLLAISSLFLFSLLGYYPTLSVPPIKQSEAKASVQEQKGEVVPASFSKPLILPHPGFLSTRFSVYHPGVDIATGLGMPIHPMIDGVIEAAGFDIWGLGNYVMVAHEKGFKSKYAHMGRIYVRAGDKVTSENILGEVGLTGRTSGPHTHMEVTLGGKFIDPLKLLPEISDIPAALSRNIDK